MHINKIYLVLVIFFSISIFYTPFINAAFGVTFTPHYINRTQVAEVNISILSGNHGNGSQVANITQVTITLTSFTFVNGTNLTTSNMNFSNTSTTVVWSATGNESFPHNTRKDFRFNISSSTAGDSTITVTATRADAANNVSSLTMTTNFDFSGIVVNATGGNESNVNITLYQFAFTNNGPPSEIYEKGAVTNGNGSFTITSINGSATNFILKMIRYGSSGSGCVSSNASCNASMIGTTLPPFPAMMYYPPSGGFDMSLNGSTFYLQDAVTLRLYAWGYNHTNTITSQRFGYHVTDQKIGFPVESNLLQNVTTKDIIVPSGKSYSVMFMRDFSQFPFGAFCNGTTYNDSACYSPPITNSTLGTLNAGDIVVVNQSLLISRNNLYGCIQVQSGHNASPINVTSIKVKMIPFTSSSGAFIPEFDGSKGDINLSDTTQLNGPNAAGWAAAGGVNCSNSAAAYNLSLIGSSSGITYFIEVYAKNTSVTNEAATHVGGNYLAGYANITIAGNTAKNITLYKLLGNYVNDTTNKNTLNTSMMKINIINDTGGAITNDMHVDVAVKNSQIGIGTVNFMIETLTNGTFYLPLLNNTNSVEVSVFPNDAPPMTKKLNLSSNDNNITLVVIEFHGGGDKGMRQFNSSGELEVINSTSMPIQIRFLRRGTNNVITEMNASNFNPMKALVAGLIDLELKVFATNVTMRFNNFDMFSAKQPPMFAILDNETAESNSQTWKFGNFVPKNVYDNVTLTIPYNDQSVTESGSFNMSIPLLFSEDQAKTHQLTAVWNLSAGHTHANLTDEFIAYNATRYRDYLTSAGMACSKTDVNAVCYINTTSNEIRMEIPHFSGVSPSMVVTTAATAATSASSSGGSGGGSSSEEVKITSNLLKLGYTSNVVKNSKLILNISGETHTVSVLGIQPSSVEIEVASTPKKTTFSVGETKKFELTNDNFYDIQVTLNSITNATKASITIKSIQEEIPIVQEATNAKEESDTNKLPQFLDKNKTTKILIISIIIFIFIMVVIFFTFFRKKKR